MDLDLRACFHQAYRNWISLQHDPTFTYAQREQAWNEYCRIRDAWLGIKPLIEWLPLEDHVN